MEKLLPQSELNGDKIALPTPCNDTIYYPANLALLGTQGRYSVFLTMSHKSGIGYIVVTQPDRVRFLKQGDPVAISEFYENIPWTEKTISNTDNGIFYYKSAPSLEEINAYFNIETL